MSFTILLTLNTAIHYPFNKQDYTFHNYINPRNSFEISIKSISIDSTIKFYGSGCSSSNSKRYKDHD